MACVNMKVILEWHVNMDIYDDEDMLYYKTVVLRIPDLNLVEVYDNWEDNPESPFSYIKGFNAALNIKLDVKEVEFRNGAFVREYQRDFYED